MMCSIALAGEITLGIHLMHTLISLYKIMFLSVVLFNSGAWDNITVTQTKKLTTVQLKFLKRILHAPSSATNCFVYLELGILPIEYNIHISQLNFLHHILNLEETDPVFLDYCQQKLFEYEKNWFNEVVALRDKYDISESDDQIREMSREKWKAAVKRYIFRYALEKLNEENSHKSKTSHHPVYEKLETQEYFSYLSPADARLYFAMRCGTVHLKSVRKYSYEEDDRTCRLCEKEEETLDHVVNKCGKISRTVEIPNIFSAKREDVIDVVARVKTFLKMVDEVESTELED